MKKCFEMNMKLLLFLCMTFVEMSFTVVAVFPAENATGHARLDSRNIDGVSYRLSVIVYEWDSPTSDANISHYGIQYWLVSNGRNNSIELSPILHLSNQSSYSFTNFDIIQGECYEAMIVAYDLNGSSEPSDVVLVNSLHPYVHHAWLEANDYEIEATVHWVIPGEFTMSKYEMHFTCSESCDVMEYIANGSSPTSYTFPLVRGQFYDFFFLIMFKENECQSTITEESTSFTFNYLVAPPTPSNVWLYPNPNVASDPTSSLLLIFDLSNVFVYYNIFVTFVSDDHIVNCSSAIATEEFNTTTNITLETNQCNLIPSTSYYAIVKIQSQTTGFFGNKFVASGNESLPSNAQATVPDPVKNLEIEGNEGSLRGKLNISWAKASGGDEINYFLLKCESASYEVTEEVAFVPGQTLYEHTTVDLVQGETVNVTVSSCNSAGNSTEVKTFYSIPVPIPSNVTITDPKSNLSAMHYYKVSWKMPKLYSVSQYHVFIRELRSNVEWTKYSVTQVTQVTITATCPGQTVSAAVEAVNNLFFNNTQNPWGNVSPWYQTDFPVPTNVTLSQEGTYDYKGHLSVNWLSDACTVSYKVILRSQRGEVLEFETDGNKTFPVEAGEMYEAFVQPFTDYGEGNLSLPSQPEQTEPYPILDLKIEYDYEFSSVTLTWDTVGFGDNVTIVWRRSNSYEYKQTVGFNDKRFETSEILGYNYTAKLFASSYFLESNITFAEFTTRPYTVFFNLTVTSFTSIQVYWYLPPGGFQSIYAEVDNGQDFSRLIVDPSINPFRINNLAPYLEYTVTMYATVIDVHGFEVKGQDYVQKVLLFIEEFCDEGYVTRPSDGATVTFPRTQAGYSNLSLETCSSGSNSENDAVPYGTRSCNINAQWMEPVLLSSCTKTLEDLAEEEIADNTQREEVASDLNVLTSNSSSLTSDSIQQSTSVLESIVDTDELDQNTTSLVIDSIGNLLAAPKDELENSGVQASILSTLDEVALTVVLASGEEYHSTTTKISFAVVQTNHQNFKNIGFNENANPLTEMFGFSEGQFQTLYLNGSLNSSSSIIVPLNAFPADGRVSFYAFADNSLFTPKKADTIDDVITIAYDATVQSRLILSASIESIQKNLKDNITITFEYEEPFCSSEYELSECGEHICGFWNEQLSVWSQSGCTLTSMTEKFIECQCNHLTNFATLFAYGKAEALANNVILDILTYVCCSLSLLGSLLTIISLVIVKLSKKSPISKQTVFIMINFASSLTLLNGFLLISNLDAVTENDDVCTAIAVILHFSLFSTLLWTTVEALHVCIGIVSPIYRRTSLKTTKVFLFSAILGWGLPAICISFLFGFHLSWYKRQDSIFICWIEFDKILYLVIIPASVILLANSVIYIIVVVTYHNRNKVGNISKVNPKSPTCKSVWFSICLFLMFGISWVFGFLLFDPSTFNEVFAYLFTITTALQGFLIFILFVVRNQKIRQAVHYKMKSLQSDLRPTNLFASSST